MSSYVKVLQNVEQGNIDSLYLLYGEETFLQETLISRLKEKILASGAKDFNYDVMDGREASVASILASAETLPVLADRRLVLVKNALFFSANKSSQLGPEAVEQLVGYFSRPNPSTCLVFTLNGNIDNRKKIVKEFKKHGVVLPLNKLRGNALTRWVKEMFAKQGKDIERDALALLLMASNDLTILDKEITKLSIYAGEDKRITRPMVEECLSQTVQGDIFKLVDAMGERRSDEALRRIREMLLIGEKPMQLLVMIGRQFRLLLQTKVLLKQGYSVKQVGEKTGIHPMVLPKIIKQSKNFTEEELEQAIMDVAAIDRHFKQGYRDLPRELELLTFKVCGNK